jgi:hypothetical protein
VACLPMMAAIMAMSGVSVQLVPGSARPLLSRITEHSHYVTGLLGPTMVAGAGLGML